MKRRLAGIGLRAAALDPAMAGLFLVRISSAKLRRQTCVLQFEVLEPAEHAGLTISTSLDLCEDRLWKLAWMLKDFHYDAKLLAIDQIDPARMIGLVGVVKITDGELICGRSHKIDACAPASSWRAGTRGVA